MAVQETIEKVEVPVAGEKKPFEALFERDHPELVISAPAKPDAKKSAFEKNLDKAVKEVEPKEESKEEPKEESETDEQSSETKEVPPADDTVEETSKEEDKSAEDVKDKAEADTASAEARIKEYAEKNSITVEKAKEAIEEYRGIAEKYKNDPIELAKAYKNMQSAFDKQKAADTQSHQARMVSDIMADSSAFVAKAEKEHAPKWIESYRKSFPAKSEAMTDEMVLEECRQVALNSVRGQVQEYQIKLKSEASTRREDLLKTLKDSERPFAQEIGQVLKNLPDVQVVDKGFNFPDLVRWARGSEKNMQRLIKEAEERGFKRAQAAEIVGEKYVAKTPSSSKPKPKENKSAGESMSNFEKQRAREMFASAYDNDEDRYAAYVDVVKNRKK